jgi:sugar phosphate isomerase/epimerase
MQYGAMNHPIKPVLNELEEIAQLGFDYLELTLDPPRAHYSQIRQQKKDLLSALDRHGMNLVCHLPTFLSLADLTESVRKNSLNEVLKSIEVAAELNPLKIVAHPAYIGGLGVFVLDQARQYAKDGLAAVVQMADQLGLDLCLENMFPRCRYGIETEEFIEIFEQFPALKLTLDTGHAHIGSPGGKRTLEFIETFPDRIGHVHISDNFGKEDNHLPVGTGTINFRRIVRALKRIEYEETVTFEIFSRDRDYLRISREKFDKMWAIL